MKPKTMGVIHIDPKTKTVTYGFLEDHDIEPKPPFDPWSKGITTAVVVEFDLEEPKKG